VEPKYNLRFEIGCSVHDGLFVTFICTLKVTIELMVDMTITCHRWNISVYVYNC